MDLIETIQQRKSATLSLKELEQLCRTSDYGSLISEIKALINAGILRPMGKDTNGMTPPLPSRYRICRINDDIEKAKDEIMRLGAEFNPSGYLTNILLYSKHRELLRGLVDYVRNNGTELTYDMSKNERSYAIWGNEKQLDDTVCRSMLRFTGWEHKLNYYDTPEPFLDYLCNGSDTKSILILENKDIWYSLRNFFMEKKAPCSLYGECFDGLLYGEGKKITRMGALEDYSREAFAKPPSFSYWGDLDYEGLSIFLKVSTFPVRLFVAGYKAMLGLCRDQVLTKCRTNQAPPSQMGKFLEFFDSSDAIEIITILEAGKYIPQEICSNPRLRAALKAV